MTALLTLKNLRKSFAGETLLDINEWVIPEGVCMVLSGRNGAGKSTLLKIVAGLEPPDHADLVFPQRQSTWRHGKRQLQSDTVYLHQHPYLFDRSVADNIAYGLRQRGLSTQHIRDQVERALSWAGLTHLANKNGRRLSGGEKQRVALTRARILTPKLLLLDEPFANMDLAAREQTLFYIRRLKQEGISTIVTTHEPYVAQIIGDQHLHLCKTGPCRFTLTEPFLYQRDREKPARTASSRRGSAFATDDAAAQTALEIDSADITAAILAGGASRRMGQVDKGLMELGGKPLVAHVAATLAPQVGELMINANLNLERYRALGYPLVEDMAGEFHGPLVGMASALGATRRRYLLTVPCDSPLLPKNLAQRLSHALSQNDADISVAHDGKRMQPIFALLRQELFADLCSYLENGGRKIDTWYAEHKCVVVDFSDCREAFLNVNTSSEWDNLERKYHQRNPDECRGAG